MSVAWLLGIAFVLGAAIILGRLAWVHHVPGVPRKIRKLGPLPRDPGMRPPPDIRGDPFRR